MLFNSLEFLFFLPIVFIIYWCLSNHNLRHQNIFLLASSYFFYGWWDWRFLFLIILSSLIDFLIGKALSKSKHSQTNRKILLSISILANLGLLCFFKYYNFFLESFVESFQILGYDFKINRLNIILPVGISFYTFQTLSYTIDVYRKKIKSTNDIISFFTFVSFFPQLVAGPIERASNLLPQFSNKRLFDYNKSVDGLRQILWGLFKKIVIADSCSIYVNEIFSNYASLSGSTLLFGSILFAFQIYGDFSGYSDIAIGTAKLFGFKLMANFKFPYFSRDISEFWRRWHISLSTWFRDYLYIPLGGSKGSLLNKIRNTFIIFIVSGFWHGANWTFIVWGGINALFFLPLLITKQNRKNIDSVASGKIFPSLKELAQIIITFFMTTLAWIFFRSESLPMSFHILSKIFSSSLFTINTNEIQSISGGWQIVVTCILLIIFIFIEWLQREKKHGLYIDPNKKNNYYKNKIFYFILIFTILFSINFHSPKSFIYFQF